MQISLLRETPQMEKSGLNVYGHLDYIRLYSEFSQT